MLMFTEKFSRIKMGFELVLTILADLLLNYTGGILQLTCTHSEALRKAILRKAEGREGLLRRRRGRVKRGKWEGVGILFVLPRGTQEGKIFWHREGRKS